MPAAVAQASVETPGFVARPKLCDNRGFPSKPSSNAILFGWLGDGSTPASQMRSPDAIGWPVFSGVQHSWLRPSIAIGPDRCTEEIRHETHLPSFQSPPRPYPRFPGP